MGLQVELQKMLSEVIHPLEVADLVVVVGEHHQKLLKLGLEGGVGVEGAVDVHSDEPEDLDLWGELAFHLCIGFFAVEGGDEADIDFGPAESGQVHVGLVDEEPPKHGHLQFLEPPLADQHDL